jgi:hypothetical protein
MIQYSRGLTQRLVKDVATADLFKAKFLEQIATNRIGLA